MGGEPGGAHHMKVDRCLGRRVEKRSRKLAGDLRAALIGAAFS